jgi:hypothetical protein
MSVTILGPDRGHSPPEGMMSPELEKLSRLMPVPKSVRDHKVKWDLLEKSVGLAYPVSFKEFVSMYGALRWFDRWCPVYCTGTSKKEIADYLDFCKAILERFQSARFDSHGKPIFSPPVIYPTRGGLFPFMASCDGDEYCWVTKGNPEEWSVVCLNSGRLTKLGKTTITRMFVDWIEGKKKMENLWFNYQRFAKDQPQCIKLFP